MRPPTPTDDDRTAASRLAGSGPALQRTRTRSFCFLEREQVRWMAFLITYQRSDGSWRGYFTFRSASEDSSELREVRTADVFVEATEEEVDVRARGLGRPLIMALLESALDAEERRRGYSPEMQRWFRELLRRHSQERTAGGGGLADAPALGVPSLSQLRSLYDSYRVDQVAHLIALLEPDHFRELVEIRLEGRRIDFNRRDRFQLAMIVVQDLERRLPLPPFEIWVEDYLANREEYRKYSRALHSTGELP